MSDGESEDSEMRNLFLPQTILLPPTVSEGQPSAQTIHQDLSSPTATLPLLPLLLEGNEDRRLPRLQRRDTGVRAGLLETPPSNDDTPHTDDFRFLFDPDEIDRLGVPVLMERPIYRTPSPTPPCILPGIPPIPERVANAPIESEQSLTVFEESESLPVFEDLTVKSSLEVDNGFEELVEPSGSKWQHLCKMAYTGALVVFSAWLITGALLAEKARLSKAPNPLATILISWFLLILLATMEGGQGGLMDLQLVEQDDYSSSHPFAHQCTTLTHRGDNMKRFIVGRQFLVFIVVFLANMFKIMNAPDSTVVDTYFLSSSQFWSGATVILTVIMFGQLTAQVNALNSTLDFVNSRMMVFATHASLLVEQTGILHSAYLFPSLFARMARIPPVDKPEESHPTLVFWGKTALSLGLFGFVSVVILGAIIQGKTSSASYMPGPIAVLLLVGLTIFVGMFEALQIALFQAKNVSRFDGHPVAQSNCELAFCGDNLRAILIGRQICVTIGVFSIAQLTTPHGDHATLFGLPPNVQLLFHTGLPGAFMTTIAASLAWRVVAASFPLHVLSHRWMRSVIRVCLLLDSSSISAAGVLDLYQKTIAGGKMADDGGGVSTVGVIV